MNSDYHFANGMIKHGSLRFNGEQKHPSCCLQIVLLFVLLSPASSIQSDEFFEAEG